MLVAVLFAASALCGWERRAVKTMTDPDAPNVQLAPVRSSIAEVAALPRPPSAHGRRRSAERQVVTLDGYVVQVRNEDDGDLHVVLADEAYTMIIEFPHDVCMRASRVFSQATKARQDLMRFLGNGPVHGNLKVRVTGVVFFDRWHNQSGVASNAVELHPVLAVQALEGASSEERPSAATAGLAQPEPSALDAISEPGATNPPQRACCKICRASQPCGDSCISLAYVCHRDAGCACWGR